MKILVTGASGFIGGRFARFALEQGLQVRVNGRRAQSVEHLVRRGAQFMQGDLLDADLAKRLCIGVDAVVHCAGAPAGMGRYPELLQGNVQLTENIVEGCLKEQVRRLVHLSCASVYRNGRSQLGIQEEQLPRRLQGHHAKTKLLAEQKVFGAAEFGLETIVLRPHAVVGAGDMSLFPRLLELQRRNRLSIIGEGLNKVDFTSVQNLNEALLSALLSDPAALDKACNISNGVPVPLWDVINYALRQMQLAPVRRYRSGGLAWTGAALNEGLCRLWPARAASVLSRAEVQAMHTDFTLDIGRARHLLDYQPTISLWAAVDEFCAWWSAQHGGPR